MPRRRNFKPFVAEAFTNGTLTWDSAIQELKHVKGTMGGQLAAYGLHTLIDVVLLATECATLLEVAQLFASLLVSPRLHECAANNTYLPRPFNRFAFNALADLLNYAVVKRTQPPFANQPAVRNRLHAFRNQQFHLEPNSTRAYLINEYNEHDRANVGRNALVRAARACPCKTTAATCNAAPWVGGGAVPAALQGQPMCRWVPESHQNAHAGCVARALSHPDGATREQARRAMAPDEFFDPDDADLYRAEAGPLQGFVRAPGQAGAFRKVHQRRRLTRGGQGQGQRRRGTAAGI